MTKRALIIDNDFFFVEFMADLLSERGYKVVKAYDGKEGLQAFDEHTVDLLFLDMVIPKVDGWHLIHYARQRFADTPFPIVAVSGTIIEQLDVLDDVGADYYIAKGPLDRMKHLIHQVLDQVETRPFPADGDRRIYDLDILYPRRESVALIESLHFQRAVSQCIGMGLLIVDRDSRILGTNALAQEVLERPEVHILNRPVLSVFPDTEKAKIVHAMKKVAKDPQCRRVPMIITVDGCRIRLIVSLLRQQNAHKGWIVAMEAMDTREDSD